ncbi:hypothetical protein, partial [Aeromonas caviae]|uniref:hypothetical protein n=1 Tax=Aeromonas caviae TaxID=648 RepID=UPI001FFCB317
KSSNRSKQPIAVKPRKRENQVRNDGYRWTREISQTLWLLSKRLEVTTGAPQVKNMSIRCYKTWNDFITQTFLNVDYSSHQGQ